MKWIQHKKLYERMCKCSPQVIYIQNNIPKSSQPTLFAFKNNSNSIWSKINQMLWNYYLFANEIHFCGSFHLNWKKSAVSVCKGSKLIF